ncbi:uncharacterized protein LOC128162962 isoform X1 [Crassostrea angulata]|uniref:uncharacterized protein LOC128162962 isoform X1 n=1 Tax=Magallana angulata TaxID=2784310 RepID=UPI0022B206A6|nr:uncharacterized protein LOC128162962 isoform X1 [Crassostrea angulata]
MKKLSNSSANRKCYKSHPNKRTKSRAHARARRFDGSDRSQPSLLSIDASNRRRQREFSSGGSLVKNDQGTQSEISMADGTLWSMFPLCPFDWSSSDTASFPDFPGCNNLDINLLLQAFQSQWEPTTEQDMKQMTEHLEEHKARIQKWFKDNE